MMQKKVALGGQLPRNEDCLPEGMGRNRIPCRGMRQATVIGSHSQSTSDSNLLKLVRKRVSSETDSIFPRSDLSAAAEYIYIVNIYKYAKGLNLTTQKVDGN